MSGISISQRAEAVRRGKQALEQLHQHPATSRKQLGNAREVLNRIYSWSDPAAVRDAVEGIESLVTEIYRGDTHQTD